MNHTGVPLDLHSKVKTLQHCALQNLVLHMNKWSFALTLLGHAVQNIHMYLQQSCDAREYYYSDFMDKVLQPH